MSEFDDAVADMAAVISEVFHDDGTYTPAGGAAVACRVGIERNVEVTPRDAPLGVTERRTVLELLASEVPAPLRGAVVAVGSESWTLDAVLENDGTFIRVVVR